MRRYSPPYYSPPYYSPPRRGYGGRARSPPRARSPTRRGHGGGGYGRSKEHGSLLVRNIPLSTRPDELRVPFERFGVVRDVYIPKDYYTGKTAYESDEGGPRRQSSPELASRSPSGSRSRSRSFD